MRKLITERDVIEVWKKRQREISVPANTIITPAATDAAKIRQIRIEIQSPSNDTVPSVAPSVESHGSPAIILGSDHGGFELKEILKEYLIQMGLEVEDVGTHSTESVDYPDFASKVAVRVNERSGSLGVIVDGAGVGSAMTANKVPGIRAATCHDVYTAQNSRLHNDANVLTLGSRVLGIDVAKGILKVWLESDFEGGRHQTRVNKIMEVERRFRG
jgi:ribose 5-phosphate isomerase B